MNTLSLLALSFQPAKIIKPEGGFSAEGIGIWIAAILTLLILSFLYKDNPFYKLAESIFVGVSIGYIVGQTYHRDVLSNVYTPMVKNLDPQKLEALHWFKEIPYLIQHYRVLDYWPLVALLMGILTLAPFVAPKQAWLTAIPFAFYIGAFTGPAIPSTIQASILTQLYGTASAFSEAGTSLISGTFAPWQLFSTFLLLIGIASTLWYFYFSLEHKGWLGGGASRLGIWFVMVGFGAAFGFTVMARVSLLLGRVFFLFRDWLGIITF